MQVLKRDRFSLLLKFIHLSDNSSYIPKGDPGHDPLYKIRPFLDPLLKNFQATYVLGREESLDEAMIGFKGRLRFIQYLPKKPKKWGMKALCTASTYKWKLYTGTAPAAWSLFCSLANQPPLMSTISIWEVWTKGTSSFHSMDSPTGR